MEKNNPRAEYEYVYGKGAGIQRFKDGFHGRDNINNLLDESGLLAFVKNGNFNDWKSKINQWISDAQWGKNEWLQVLSFDQIGQLLSHHNRRNASPILLYHFWLDVAD